jgi:hypothetical protein
MATTSELSKIRSNRIKEGLSKVPWTKEEDAKLLQMRNDGRSWEYIVANSLAGAKEPPRRAVRQSLKSNTAITRCIDGPVILELEAN